MLIGLEGDCGLKSFNGVNGVLCLIYDNSGFGMEVSVVGVLSTSLAVIYGGCDISPRVGVCSRRRATLFRTPRLKHWTSCIACMSSSIGGTHLFVSRKRHWLLSKYTPAAWALPLCLAAPVLGACCDTSGRLRLVRTLLAVHRCTMEYSTLFLPQLHS